MHCVISIQLMSQMGQQRRIGPTCNSSAHPPIADMQADMRWLRLRASARWTARHGTGTAVCPALLSPHTAGLGDSWTRAFNRRRDRTLDEVVRDRTTSAVLARSQTQPGGRSAQLAHAPPRFPPCLFLGFHHRAFPPARLLLLGVERARPGGILGRRQRWQHEHAGHGAAQAAVKAPSAV